MSVRALWKSGKYFIILLLVMTMVSCKQGGGSGTDGGGAGEKEEIKAPEAAWEEENVSMLVKDDTQEVELEITEGELKIRLTCRAAVSGAYQGYVSGGEVQCVTENPRTYQEEKHEITVMGGNWEQGIGVDGKQMKGLRFELSGYDQLSGMNVQLRILNWDLRVTEGSSTAERRGYVEHVGEMTVMQQEVILPGNNPAFTIQAK